MRRRDVDKGDWDWGLGRRGDEELLDLLQHGRAERDRLDGMLCIFHGLNN